MIKRILTVALLCNILFISTAISQTKRYVKTVAGGTGDGSSWANASANLQAMIDASANNDEVWVAKGTYKPTTVVGYNASHIAYTDDRHKSFYVHTGVKLYGGFVGTEITPGQRKLAQNKTYLSGDLLGNDGAGLSFTNNAENAYHVIVAISAHTVRIDGFMISGGNTTGMPATYLNDAPVYTQIPADGAGVYFYDCDYNITSSIFFNNYTTGKGGAVSNYSSGETGDLINSVFVNNFAVQGSVLYASNSGPNNGASNITNCTIFKNFSNAATVFTQNNTNNVIIYNSVIMANWGSGKAIDTTLIHAYYSTVQFTSVTPPGDPGPDPLDPYFSNYFDADGVDNILGTSDDGLVPGPGSAAIDAGFNNLPNLPAKDIRDSVRIQNGTIDRGAYETSCGLSVNSISITQSFDPDPNNNNDNNPYNDLPAPGLCEGGTAHFTATLIGSGGTFQWKKNGVIVGANSNTYNPTDFHLNDQVWVTYTFPSTCGSGFSTIQSNVITLQNVSTGIPVISTSIIGSANACPYINGAPVAYKINKVPGAVVYDWSLVAAAGASIVSHPNGAGANDTIVMIAFTQDFTAGSISARARNWCGYSNIKRITFSLKIAQSTGVITGPTDVCPYIQSPANPGGTPATYSIRKVVDASSYIWTVPAGATIASHPNGTGFNDTVITVLYSSSFVSGTITAQGVNFCGAKPARTLSVLKRNVATPGTITGPTSVCAFKQSPSNPSGTPVNYTIRRVLYATSYTWTLPANATATHPGGTGINDTIIRVTYNSSFTGGTITVKANNNCNTSAAKSLTILFILPSTPGVITAGIPTGCPMRRITYSLAAMPGNATSVQWTAPPSGTIISGQGTLSVVVEFAGATSSTDSIRVVGKNDCGTSASQRKLKVGVLPSCRAGKSNEENIPTANAKVPLVDKNTHEFEVAVMPNPSQHQFNLVLTGKDYKTPVSLQVVNTTGRSIESKTTIQNNQTITIGNNWSSGIYFVTLIQGQKKKVLRLVKL